MKPLLTLKHKITVGLCESELTKARKALNIKHYGNETIPLTERNIPLELKSAHWEVGIYQEIELLVDIFEDGSKVFRMPKKINPK